MHDNTANASYALKSKHPAFRVTDAHRKIIRRRFRLPVRVSGGISTCFMVTGPEGYFVEDSVPGVYSRSFRPSTFIS